MCGHWPVRARVVAWLQALRRSVSWEDERMEGIKAKPSRSREVRR